MIADYAWRGGREAMLRLGPATGATLVVIPPLFEEANRMRRLLVEVMRELAVQGIASVLPDLPATSDSPVATIDARLEDWREAVASLTAVLPTPVRTVAVRGGCLLDATAEARWRLAPVSGASVLRDMVRATALSTGVKAAELAATARATPTRLAGNMVHPELYASLEAAVVAGEAQAAAIAGTPWRRAEPGDDYDFVAAMVADIVDWSKTCAVL